MTRPGLAALLLLLASSLGAAPRNAPDGTRRDVVPGRLMVRFEAGLPSHARAAARAAIGGTRRRAFGLVPGLESLDVPPGRERALARTLGKRPGVRYAHPVGFSKVLATPDDPLLAFQWGLDRIDAAAAWDVTTGSATTVVAILDEGVQVDHPDLAANIWVNPGETPGNSTDDDSNGKVDDVNGWDFLGDDAQVFDDPRESHGTHVAGIAGAAGDDGRGVTGVAWNLRLMSLKVCGPTGCPYDAQVEAIDYAVAEGARVLNMSLGGKEFVPAVRDALAAAGAAGCLVVAAAGNEFTDIDDPDLTPTYPAAYELPNVLAVAALSHDDTLAPFSNRGPVRVDLAAPGHRVVSTYPTDRHESLSGTSMAAPYVAGAAALLLSADPSQTVSDVRHRILSTTEALGSLGGLVGTSGVLDLEAALGASANQASSLAITQPTSGSTTSIRTTVTLDLAATDPEDGDIASSAIWFSSIDGLLGGGAPLAHPGLTAGLHTLTGTVTDSGGRSTSASITLNVTSTVTFGACTGGCPGPLAVSTGVSNAFTAPTATSSLGHGVQYRFDWGDGMTSGWQGSATASHTFATTGTFTVRAQARSSVDVLEESAWSDPVRVSAGFDDHEPDEFFGDGPVLSDAVTYTRMLAPSDEYDLFQFTLPGVRDVAIWTSGPPADTVIELYEDAPDFTFLDFDDDGSGTRHAYLTAEGLEAGTYNVAVYHHDYFYDVEGRAAEYTIEFSSWVPGTPPPPAAAGTAPRLLGLQGRLTGASGTADLALRLFPVETSGSPVAAETDTVALDAAGIWFTGLGDGASLDPADFAQVLWLDVVVDGEPTSPRTTLTAMPSAARASRAAGLRVPVQQVTFSGTGFDDADVDADAGLVVVSAGVPGGDYTLNLPDPATPGNAGRTLYLAPDSVAPGSGVVGLSPTPRGCHAFVGTFRELVSDGADWICR